MSKGHFIAKWDFRCGYCRKTFPKGSSCFHILKHDKKACEKCRDNMVDKFYGWSLVYELGEPGSYKR